MKKIVSDLSHHPLNSEIYSLSNIEDLERSINEVGLLQPLVINEKNQVISGNRRLEAVRRLGWSKVDCEVIKTSNDEEEMSLLVHYNKQRRKTLREILNEASVLFPLLSVGQGKRTDLTSVSPNKSVGRDAVADAIGLSSGQLARILFISKENDEYIDLIDDGQITINQSYLHLSRIRKQREGADPKNLQRSSRSSSEKFIFYIKSSRSMTELEENSIDCVFTSPPYWNKRNYANSSLGSEENPQKYVGNLIDHFQDTQRVLKKTGSFFLNIGDTYEKGNLQNIPHRIVIGLQDNGWILRNTIIWHKSNPKPHSSKNSLTPSYEFIFHLVLSPDYKYRHTLSEAKSDNHFRVPRHRNLEKESKIVYPMMPRDGKNMGDYWSESVVESAVARNIATPEGVEHPAPFPDKIVMLPILQTTDENDLVLDPFMGTGTTGRVANSLGRRFVGYDVSDFLIS